VTEDDVSGDDVSGDDVSGDDWSTPAQPSPGAGWLAGVAALRTARQPGVLVTVADVRGHAPRAAGAKMVVAAERVWGTIGGGNLEATATARARGQLGGEGPATRLETVALSDRAPHEHGLQCCGGEVTLLFERLPVVPSVAVFGVGHVGLELARILARHDLELHLVDTRPGQLSPARLAVLDDAVARVHVHAVPLLPEIVLDELPAGSSVLVMTHDHAEDIALCDAVLRREDVGWVGLIGSAGKWARFRRRLAEDGHSPEAIATITTPIGLPGISGKDPATIAVSVAADLLRRFEEQAAGHPAGSGALPAGRPT
jgi:xanthine dehydrogenase accessory factor